MSLGVSDDKLRAALENAGIKEKEMSNAVAMSVAMFREAMHGNVGAYKALTEAGKDPNDGTAEQRAMLMKVVAAFDKSVDAKTD